MDRAGRLFSRSALLRWWFAVVPERDQDRCRCGDAREDNGEQRCPQIIVMRFPERAEQRTGQCQGKEEDDGTTAKRGLGEAHGSDLRGGESVVSGTQRITTGSAL